MLFRSMREAGVRAVYTDALVAPAVRTAMSQSPAGRTTLERYDASAQSQGETPLDAQGVNPQQRAEAYLNAKLSESFNVWAARADFRGQLYWQVFHLRKRIMTWRNRLMGIDTSAWKVRIDPAQYALNRAALDATLASAAQVNIPVLLYIAPRPIDAYFPYEPAAYEAFKHDMETLAARHGAHFANLENAVVGDVWGTIDNGVGDIVTDIFHFKASGHEQMAAGVMKELLPVLSGVTAK